MHLMNLQDAASEGFAVQEEAVVSLGSGPHTAELDTHGRPPRGGFAQTRAAA